MIRIIILLSVSLLSFIGCANQGYLTGGTNATIYPAVGQAPKRYSFQLSGRSLVDSLSKTERDQQENVIVVVKIKVDRNGYVVGAEYSQNGSTTRDSRLVSAAVRSATKVRFNNDTKAPAIANGTIT